MQVLLKKTGFLLKRCPTRANQGKQYQTASHAGMTFPFSWLQGMCTENLQSAPALPVASACVDVHHASVIALFAIRFVQIAGVLASQFVKSVRSVTRSVKSARRSRARQLVVSLHLESQPWRRFSGLGMLLSTLFPCSCLRFCTRAFVAYLLHSRPLALEVKMRSRTEIPLRLGLQLRHSESKYFLSCAKHAHHIPLSSNLFGDWPWIPFLEEIHRLSGMARSLNLPRWLCLPKILVLSTQRM